MGTIELSFMLGWFTIFGAGVGLPLGVPPAAEDPVISRAAPEDCLYYTTWSASARPVGDNNPTERWMAQDEIQRSYAALVSAVRGALQAQAEREGESAAIAVDSFEIGMHLLTHSAALYIDRAELVGEQLLCEGAAIVHLGDAAPAINQRCRRVQQFAAAGSDFQEVTIDGTPFFRWELPQFAVPFFWGIRGDYLFLGLGEGSIERLLANSRTPPPAWLVELRGQLAIERFSNISCLNAKQLWKLTDQAAAPPEFDEFLQHLDLKSITQLAWSGGVDRDGFVLRGRLVLDGEAGGIFQLVGKQGLDPDDLRRVPADVTMLAAGRLNVAQAVAWFDQWNRSAGSGGSLQDHLDQIEPLSDLDIQRDILQGLGDTVYMYGSYSLLEPTKGWVAALQVREEMAFTVSYQKVVGAIRSLVAQNPDLGKFETSTVDGTEIYSIVNDAPLLPVEPSWCLEDGELLLSLNRGALRRHVRGGQVEGNRLVDLPAVKAAFQSPIHGEAPVAMSVVDTAGLVAMAVSALQGLAPMLEDGDFDFDFVQDVPSVQVLTRGVQPTVSAVYRTPTGFQTFQRQTYPGSTPDVALLMLGGVTLPAVFQARAAAHRVDSANRLRQLILAMHNYHDSFGALPAAYSQAADDKPLLSWRVYVLPFIDEQALFEEFHLDEPWDSEHNKQLIERMPEALKHPNLELEPGMTVYLAATGENALLAKPTESVAQAEFPTGMKLGQVTDGTSNTIALLEANARAAVIWTKPDDFDIAAEDLMAKLRDGANESGFNAALADGSVQFFSNEIPLQALKNLLQTNDGNVIDRDDW